MLPNRKDAAAMGREAVEISRAGHYLAPSGARIAIDVETGVRGAISYPPDAEVPPIPDARFDTRITVENETTLAGARHFASGARSEPLVVPAALNFASAKHPGGGFLGGARAQEESLARSSALFVTIEESPMYAFHDARRDAMYTAYAIYSPSVPVFRGDDGALLEAPYAVAFVTSPAPNAGVVLGRDPNRRSEVEREMRARIEKVLRIMAGHGHRAIVLGAWGCGVFRCDPRDTALAFRDALLGPFRGVFEDVRFSVLDSEGSTIAPFIEAFTFSPRAGGGGR
jgi:uncharacterized protein (TIGR02452 family)